MIIKTTIADIPRSEYLCEHMCITRSVEEVEAKWAELRGTEVIINTEDFIAGKCRKCDRFGVATDPNRRTLFRSQLVLGD